MNPAKKPGNCLSLCFIFWKMKKMHVITPVKDSIRLTIETIRAVLSSEIKTPFAYTVYNDFSTEENTRILEKESRESGFSLVNLSDCTTNPSPNYLLILQMAQEKAIQDGAGLLIVESDVLVEKNTLQALFDGASSSENCGIAAAVTVDEKGEINYPYLYAKKEKNKVVKTNKRLSFCCTLLTLSLLENVDFSRLDPEKDWYDVTISREALKWKFNNYLFANLTVWHRPHSSRPWKQLKYTNPVRYYWLKLVNQRDKI